MSKYVIDIPNGVEWGVVTCRTEDGFYTRDFDSLEELNSDYINEHFGDLQDTAYKKGLAEGREQMPCDTCAYRHNKLLCADCKWTYGSRYKVDNIGVGDIIANNTEPKLKAWVTGFDEIGFCGIAITDFGTVDGGKLYSSCSPKGWHKIGHFDIQKILEDMRHD